MATGQDFTRAKSSEVVFELEHAEWTSADRLEIVGRWFGVRGLRFMRPTLHVEVDGEPRRMLAVLDHKPWAAEDGERWVAAFAWHGERVELAGSELTVGPNLAVEVVPAGEKRPARRRHARPSRADVLERELAVAQAEAGELARELHGARAVHAAEVERREATHAAELERVRAELRAERGKTARMEAELREAREGLAGVRAEWETERGQLHRERAAIAAEVASATAGDTERIREERDAAIRDAAGARSQLASARRESVRARAERDAAIRDRDRAQQERNVLLSRVRSDAKRQSAQPKAATPRPSSPPAASEEARPIPAGEDASSPLEASSSADPAGAHSLWDRLGRRSRPPARPAAMVALMALAAVVALLVAEAL